MSSLFPGLRAADDFELEIDPEVDFDSRRAVYFRQMRYGLFVSFTPSILAKRKEGTLKHTL